MSNDERETPENRVSFETALVELEAIVRELEEGQVPLAEALSRYEQGVKLLRQCYHELERVERKIELLSRVDSTGAAQCETFDDRPLSLEEKANSRGKRRSQTGLREQDEIDESGRLF
jgi:exodeoxyribonuclease VII small subunit